MAVTTSQITITTMEGWYSGDTAPSNPLIGDLWLDTTTNEIKKWNGTTWIKQADAQGPQGPKGDSIKSREAYWIKSSSSIAPEPPDPKTGDMKGWTEGSEPPESALAGILPSDKFWRIYKETYSNGESEYIKYSDVELIGSYEVLNGLVQFRNGVTTTENIGGQDVTVIDGGKILTGSIEADKMSIKDLSALKAKIGGFNIGKNSIYSGTKSSINNTEKGIYFDSNGHSYFGDDKNFIRFYQSAEDGKYKLQVSADSLTFGSSESVEKAIDNLEIGGRNLLPDTDFGDTSKKYIVPDGVVEGSGGEGGFMFTPTMQIESEIEYTLSLKLRGSANITFYEINDGVNVYHRLATKSDLSETDYKKIRFTFAVKPSRTFRRVYICTAWGLSATGDWFEIEPKSLKLEKGNKATDWTPAPEDVDAGITDAQTAADEALKGTKENAAQMAQMVTDFNGDIKNLQDQIDGNITTWFYNVDPAMNLPPVTDWDTDKKKDAHLGDIYYNTVKGYAWRFMKSGSTYSWERITDTDVTKALADAANAQDTADSKRRVFYSTPTVPYDAGDLWVQGSDGDILRCAQAKKNTGSYDRNDWVLASKYTDNSALNTWIEGDFATTIQGLEEGLVDAKIETYYQTTDPSTGWSSTQKSEHKGDLWYNSTTSVQKYYRWSGTAWQELTATPPKEVFDSIDNKATIYTGTTPPSSPSQGDLWFKGVNEPILTYVNNSWVEYNKYTDDSTLNTWLKNTYTVDKINLEKQIDGKAETWYQNTDPSLKWSADEKSNHEGDLWYNTSNNTTWYYTGSDWLQQNIPTSVFNNINGKANIFVGSTTPDNPKTGDLWMKSTNSDILTYVNGSWVKYNKYTDDTRAEEAAKTADNYISADSTGIMVSKNTGATKETPSNATKNNVLITEKDVQIRNGKKTVASYGSSVIIGNDEGNSIHIGSSGIDMVAEGQPLAKFGLSNATKYAPVLYDVINKNLTDRKCTGLSTYKINKNYANEGELKTHVTVKLIYHENDNSALDNNAIVPLDEYHPNSYTLGIADDHIKITFDENVFQTEVKHFRPSYEGDFSDVDIALTYPAAYGLGMATIGNRLNWPEYNDTGDFSLAIGTGNVADDYSMAMGVLSFAQAYSIACGNLCTAGANSCAFGYSNQAEQGNSFALGSFLHTDAPNQLVIGYKNKTTAEGITARFVVAGGSQDEVNEEEPYNSAAITGDGDVRIKGDLYAHCNDDSGGGISFTKITSGTGTAKATTGSVSMQPKWWRCGNLVQMEFRVAAKGAVKPGANIATGTITGIPRPVTTTGLRAVSYYGDNANVTFVSQDGDFTVRNCGSDALAKGNDAIGIFTYITDGTFTGGA